MADFNSIFADVSFGPNGMSFNVDRPNMPDMSDVALVINQRIANEKKPAQTFIKQLSRIENHWDQLQDAVLTLLKAYENTQSTAPRKRTSAATMARRRMLEPMSDKFLKAFATEYLPDTVGDYILPDDRSALITALLESMANTENSEKEAVEIG